MGCVHVMECGDPTACGGGGCGARMGRDSPTGRSDPGKRIRGSDPMACVDPMGCADCIRCDPSGEGVGARMGCGGSILGRADNTPRVRTAWAAATQ